jgi:hypothetical protein
MRTMLIHACIAGFLLAGLGAPQALAQKKKVEIEKKWNGSVADEGLLKTAPAVITSAKKFESVWKEWKIDTAMPTVDFKKYIVVVVHSLGSNINLSGATLDEKGNLEAVGFGTADFGPGFRYVLGAVSREGVVTVNGKKLPTE